MGTAAYPTFSIVASPPAEPPVTGLIASLKGSPQYLIASDAEVDVDGHPNRWVGGFSYNPEQTCLSTGAADPCAMSTALSIPANPGNVNVMPWIVWAGDRCSSFGWSARDWKGRATRALLASESYAISYEMWTGAQAKVSGWPNVALASASADILSTQVPTAAEALACLEQGIAETSNGQRGMIHCTPQLGAALSELGNTLRTVDGVILTYRGTVINADAGNPGTGPAGQAVTSSSQWAYATLMPTVRRSQIVVWPDTFAEATIRGTNDIEFRAERLAAASFPPCTHIGVQVKLPLCGGGS